MVDSSRSAHVPVRREYVDELRWTFSHRRAWLIAFTANLILAAAFVGYERYSPRTGGLKLAGAAAELAAWVLASTLTTNQLGDDADNVLSRIDHGDHIVHILLSKDLVLASLLLPITLAVSVAAQLDITRMNRLAPSLAEDLLDVFVVLLWLGIGALTSVLVPYRTISLRARWRARRTWPRWLVCQGLPYVLFFTVVPLLTWPAYEAAGDLFGGRRTNLAEYSTTFVLWGAMVWVGGLALAAVYVRRARDRFLSDLRRPS